MLACLMFLSSNCECSLYRSGKVIFGGCEANLGDGAMAFKVGDVVRLKSGGSSMTVSKLFKSPEGREMVSALGLIKNQGSTEPHL